MLEKRDENDIFGFNNNNNNYKREVFWMRDFKIGNWVLEIYFGDVDVVEFREKVIFKKNG